MRWGLNLVSRSGATASRDLATALLFFSGMQDETAESIKSLEGFKRAWIDEAQSLSARSLALLRPTIRVAGIRNLVQLEPAGANLTPLMSFSASRSRTVPLS